MIYLDLNAGLIAAELNDGMSTLLTANRSLPTTKPSGEVRSNGAVELWNPNGSSTYLYVAPRPDGSVLVGEHLAALVKRTGASVDYGAIASEAGGEFLDSKTMWSEISVLTPGMSVRIAKTNGQPLISFSPLDVGLPTNEDDFACVLAQDIGIAAAYYDRVIISFSGGVDSTAILLATLESTRKPISAFTWVSEGGSSPEDLRHAKTTCARLGVQHHEFELKPDYIFRPVHPFAIAPNNSIAVGSIGARMAFFSKLREMYPEDNLLVLHGHGGDHLFFDPPLASAASGAFGT